MGLDIVVNRSHRHHFCQDLHNRFPFGCSSKHSFQATHISLFSWGEQCDYPNSKHSFIILSMQPNFCTLASGYRSIWHWSPFCKTLCYQPVLPIGLSSICLRRRQRTLEHSDRHCAWTLPNLSHVPHRYSSGAQDRSLLPHSHCNRGERCFSGS